MQVTEERFSVEVLLHFLFFFLVSIFFDFCLCNTNRRFIDTEGGFFFLLSEME